MKAADGVTLPRAALRAVLRAVLLYAFFAALWILLSDGIVARLFDDPESLHAANSLKGLAFVAFTSALLFFLLLRFTGAHPGGEAAAEDAAAAAASRRSARSMLYGAVALLAMVFGLLCAGGILLSRERHRQEAGAQLQSIARLKSTQIESWIDERHRDAEVVRTAYLFRELLPQWRSSRDAQARQRLLARLEEFRAAMRYTAVAVCDSRGDILLQAGAAGHGTVDELRAAVRQAIAGGTLQTTDLYRMLHPPPAHTHLDFVAPVPPVPGQPAAAVVLRADVGATLYPYLQVWPVPSESGETLLFRREGGEVVYLNELRRSAGAALQLRLPIAGSQLLTAKALAPDYQPGTLIDGVDYRGIAAIGVARPIAGTNWWLLAMLDRGEIFGAARRDAVWIVFSSALSWGVAVVLAVLLLQRRELHEERRRRREQAERLNALGLLSAIADASADAIFAKDRQGRYLLFNRAACAVTGRSEGEVIGHDDTALFPAAQAELVRANDRRVMDEDRLLSYEETLDTAHGLRTFLAVKGPLHGADGKVSGMYGISRDITERANAEEELRRSNAELERFNRAMVGRELEMVRLKREINAMAQALGRAAPYDLAAIDAESPASAGAGSQ